MDIREIRREIFSYLKNDTKLVCYQCNDRLILNKQGRSIYNKTVTKNYRKPICRNCYFQLVGYPDLCTVLVLLFSLIYILFVIFKLFYNI
jgi:hypothetical protein